MENFRTDHGKRQQSYSRRSTLLLVLGSVSVLLLLVAAWHAPWYPLRSTAAEQTQKWFNTIDSMQMSLARVRLQKAREIVNAIPVLCWVLTSKKTSKSQGKAILETWGKRCDKLLFMTSTEDHFRLPGRTPLPGVADKEISSAKAMELGWMYVYKHHRKDYKWFHYCDDSTYTIVENLKFFLSKLNVQRPVYTGKHFHLPKEPGAHYVGGSAGITLNRLALEKLAQQIDLGCMKDRKRSPDVLVGKCFKKARVDIAESLDGLGRNRFMPLKLEAHSQPSHSPNEPRMWMVKHSPRGDVGKSNFGPRCCSSLAISFHFIDANGQHAMEFLTRRFHKFGTKMDDYDVYLRTIRNVASTTRQPTTSNSW